MKLSWKTQRLFEQTATDQTNRDRAAPSASFCGSKRIHVPSDYYRDVMRESATVGLWAGGAVYVNGYEVVLNPRVDKPRIEMWIP